jgi:glycerol-3-phosphate dehydrogenase
VLPHHKGLRPAWLLRLGLFIYDHLGGRRILPPTRSLDLAVHPAGEPLRAGFARAFEYSDCWVDDARLVVLNARDAAARGAQVLTRMKCESARRDQGVWDLSLRDAITEAERKIRARALVNAGGPWVEKVIRDCAHQVTSDRIRLVRGSHIVTRKLFDHDRAYIFQQTDGRIVFAIPYQTDFTLIGTTDTDHTGDPGDPVCTPEEADYLCRAVSGYFEAPVTTDDIVWTYSGVRPLYDDGASSATQATRDYVLKVEGQAGEAPMLNIFGGKITTYRRLSESALTKLERWFPKMGPKWTAGAALPGGDFPVDSSAAQVERLQTGYPFLNAAFAQRLVRAYGTEAAALLDGAKTLDALGCQFGWNLTEREVRWLMEREWARTAEDVLWRRSKIGLCLNAGQIEALDQWMRACGAVGM